MGRGLGGLDGLVKRADANTRRHRQVRQGRTPWIDFLAVKPAIALQHFGVPQVHRPGRDLAAGRRAGGVLPRGIVATLEKEGAGLDLGHYRDAPPGLRIWCGATVQARDLKALMPWIAYAFALEKAKLKKAA